MVPKKKVRKHSNFLEEQGFKMGPATIYQDNMSTIALVRNGKSNSYRTRHIATRFFFPPDRVTSNIHTCTF